MNIDVADIPSSHSLRNRVGRMCWDIVWLLLYRPSPKLLHGWRRCLLRAFGARIGKKVHPLQSVRIWCPWNLEMGDHSCLGPWVDCYCVARVHIGAHATVSQYSYLCTASHDISSASMRLVAKPIFIGDGAWITADVFIGPGVTVGEGAVVAARSTVLRDVDPWTVVAGNPATIIKRRKIDAK